MITPEQFSVVRGTVADLVIDLPPLDITPGRAIILAVYNYTESGGFRTVDEIANTMGDEFVKLAEYHFDANHGLEFWWTPATNGGTGELITAVFNAGATFRAIIYGEYSGIASFIGATPAAILSDTTQALPVEIGDLVIGIFSAFNDVHGVADSAFGTIRVRYNVDGSGDGSNSMVIGLLDRIAAVADDLGVLADGTLGDYLAAGLAFSAGGTPPENNAGRLVNSQRLKSLTGGALCT